MNIKKIIKKGKMMKLTSTNIWVKRMFTLTSNELTYTSKKYQDECVIPINSIIKVVMSKKMNQKYVFLVKTNEFSLLLKCKTYEQSWKWVYVVNRALNSWVIGSTPRAKSFEPGSLVRDYADTRVGRVTWPVNISDFRRRQLLGIGSFGDVFLAEFLPTGQHYAVKELDTNYLESKNMIERTQTELKILQTIDHPFLMKMHFNFQTNFTMYFVLDVVNGGEIAYHLEIEGRFTEKRTRFYASEILLGVEYLHKQGILYRDLKSRNTLLDSEGHIVLTDFGMSKIVGDDCTNSICGTPEYFSPELVQISKKYSKEADWWAFGVFLFEMLSGILPFNQTKRSELFWHIIRTDIEFPDYFSEEAIDLIKKLTEKRATDRLTKVYMIKKHKFFEDVDWEAVEQKAIAPPFIPNIESSTDLNMIHPDLQHVEITSIIASYNAESHSSSLDTTSK